MSVESIAYLLHNVRIDIEINPSWININDCMCLEIGFPECYLCNEFAIWKRILKNKYINNHLIMTVNYATRQPLIG